MEVLHSLYYSRSGHVVLLDQNGRHVQKILNRRVQILRRRWPNRPGSAQLTAYGVRVWLREKVNREIRRQLEWH